MRDIDRLVCILSQRINLTLISLSEAGDSVISLSLIIRLDVRHVSSAGSDLGFVNVILWRIF